MSYSPNNNNNSLWIVTITHDGVLYAVEFCLSTMRSISKMKQNIHNLQQQRQDSDEVIKSVIGRKCKYCTVPYKSIERKIKNSMRLDSDYNCNVISAQEKRKRDADDSDNNDDADTKEKDPKIRKLDDSQIYEQLEGSMMEVDSTENSSIASTSTTNTTTATNDAVDGIEEDNSTVRKTELDAVLKRIERKLDRKNFILLEPQGGDANNDNGDNDHDYSPIKVLNEFNTFEIFRYISKIPFPIETLLIRNFKHPKLKEALGTLGDSLNAKHIRLVDCGLNDADIESLSRNPYVEMVTLSDNNITTKGLSYLVQNPNIKHLNLEGNALDKHSYNKDTESYSDNDLIRMAIAEYKPLIDNKTLVTLDLSRNNIGDKGATALSMNRGISSMILKGNNITLSGAIELFKSYSVDYLNLSNNDLGAYPGTIYSIPGKLENAFNMRMRPFKDLDISGCKIEARIAKILAVHMKVVKLDVTNNKFDLDAFSKLAQNTTLRSLYISHNPICEDDIENDFLKYSQDQEYAKVNSKIVEVGNLLTTVIESNNIQHLAFQETPLTNYFLTAISRIRSVKRLEIVGCGLNDVGVLILYNASDDNSNNIQHLNVACNNITDEGAQMLSKMNKLQSLDISMNSVTNIGAIALAKSTSLRKLLMGHTMIDDGCVDALLKNKTLLSIDISGNPISGAYRILRHIKNNRDQHKNTASRSMYPLFKVFNNDITSQAISKFVEVDPLAEKTGLDYFKEVKNTEEDEENEDLYRYIDKLNESMFDIAYRIANLEYYDNNNNNINRGNALDVEYILRNIGGIKYAKDIMSHSEVFYSLINELYMSTSVKKLNANDSVDAIIKYCIEEFAYDITLMKLVACYKNGLYIKMLPESLRQDIQFADSVFEYIIDNDLLISVVEINKYFNVSKEHLNSKKKRPKIQNSEGIYNNNNNNKENAVNITDVAYKIIAGVYDPERRYHPRAVLERIGRVFNADKKMNNSIFFENLLKEFFRITTPEHLSENKLVESIFEHCVRVFNDDPRVMKYVACYRDGYLIPMISQKLRKNKEFGTEIKRYIYEKQLDVKLGKILVNLSQ